MPISEERLQADVNAHLHALATDTVQETLFKWRDGNHKWGRGREWWWLIIEYDEGHYTAIPLEQLRDLLADQTNDVDFNTPLSALPAADVSDWRNPKPGVVVAKVVNKKAYSTSSAIHLAENTKGNLIVVTEDGQLAGIISKRMRNFAMANLSLLNMLENLERELTEETTSTTSNNDAPPSSDTTPSL